ncbi:isoprenoid synthase domain-containing protein [Mycena filopes]|nr:isoprenoid synthase domain-containing protein [Mycena filopes]
MSTSSANPPTIYLPDTLGKWPWSRQINPHYQEVSTESSTWLHSLKPFTAQSQRAFDKGKFEHLRTGCDLMNLFFVIDEYTDVEDAATVRGMVDVVIDALNNPHKPRPVGELILGEATRQFWSLALETASRTSARHFVESFSDYLESVVKQAELRESDTELTVEAYLNTRQHNVGLYPSLVPAELHLDLPDKVFYHPAVRKLQNCIAELVLLDNDLLSYNKEQAVGDDHHNILTIIMREFNMDLQAAIGWTCHYHAQVQARFVDGLQHMPSFSIDMDKQLREYLSVLGNWPRASACWTFECGRYFGDKAGEVEKSRQVVLLPKRTIDGTLRKENVVVQSVEL